MSRSINLDIRLMRFQFNHSGFTPTGCNTKVMRSRFPVFNDCCVFSFSCERFMESCCGCDVHITFVIYSADNFRERCIFYWREYRFRPCLIATYSWCVGFTLRFVIRYSFGFPSTLNKNVKSFYLYVARNFYIFFIVILT